MHPASDYQTDHRPPNKLKTSHARSRAGQRSTHWGRVARAAVLVAFLLAVFTVFRTSGSHAGPAGGRTTAPTPIAPSTATASSATPTVERELALSFLSAAPFQLGTESVQTFESDCTTPKVDFTLGDTICVKGSVLSSFFLGLRSIHIVGPANQARASAIVTDQSLTQTLSFTLPNADQTTIGGQSFDNRGTWRADLTTLSGARRVSVFFDVVSAQTPAADLQIVGQIEGDSTVPSNDPVSVAVYVLNVGPNAATNVVVTPPSHAGLSLQSFVPEGGTACTGNCTLASLASHTVKKFTANYNVTAPTGTKIVARASVTSETEDPRPTIDYTVDAQNPAPPANTNVASIFLSVGAPDGPGTSCTLTCPANVVATANTTVSGQFGAFVNFGAASGSGDCGAISNSATSGSFFAVGTHTINSTSETGGGSCSFTVKVVDTAAPTITCPTNKFATDTDNSGDETVAVGFPTFTASGVGTVTSLRSDSTPAVLDQDGEIITPAVPKPLTDPYLVGLTSILWTVTDADGRTASCTQTVTVSSNNCGSDTTPPTITAPDDVTVGTGAANPSCTVTLDDELGQPELNDTCSVTFTVSGVPAGNNFAPGTYTLTYTATDGAGNTASDTQVVTVVDDTAPIIKAPDDATYTCPSEVPAASPSQAKGPVLGVDGQFVVDGNGELVFSGPPFENCGTPTVTVSESSSGAGTPADPRIILRTFRATDAAGNFSESVQTITVTDGTAPTITAPAAVTANTGPGATSCDTVVDNATLGTASAQDNCAGVTVTRSPSGNTFPVGSTTVIWTATDWAGNTATAEQTVIVNDNTAPVLTPPANVTAFTGPGATSCDTLVSDATIGTATASDNCPGIGAITRTGVPAGNLFPVGTTTLNYSVTDAHGNTTNATQTVTVVDNTAPVVTPPAAVTLFTGPGATSCGVTVSNLDATFGTATATDNCPGVGTPTRSGVPAGNFFPVGQTTLTYSVIDAHGNQGTATQIVTVVDNTAPVITCPSNIVLEPSCPSGAIATWTEPATSDNCGVQSVVRTGPASGSVFPIGTTTVSYTVTDIHGNAASCSFTVTVLTAAQTVQNMIARVQALQPPLSGTQVQGLNSKLQAALDAINQGKTNVACNKLNDFISQVTGFINNGTLTSAQGQPLITSAAKVRNTLGCTSNPCT
jgi:HYR domain